VSCRAVDEPIRSLGGFFLFLWVCVFLLLVAMAPTAKLVHLTYYYQCCFRRAKNEPIVWNLVAPHIKDDRLVVRASTSNLVLRDFSRLCYIILLPSGIASMTVSAESLDQQLLKGYISTIVRALSKGYHEAVNEPTLRLIRLRMQLRVTGLIKERRRYLITSPEHGISATMSERGVCRAQRSFRGGVALEDSINATRQTFRMITQWWANQNMLRERRACE
jgi:hypothetical protein